jgi:hypothetical protein
MCPGEALTLFDKLMFRECWKVTASYAILGAVLCDVTWCILVGTNISEELIEQSRGHDILEVSLRSCKQTTAKSSS